MTFVGEKGDHYQREQSLNGRKERFTIKVGLDHKEGGGGIFKVGLGHSGRKRGSLSRWVLAINGQAYTHCLSKETE